MSHSSSRDTTPTASEGREPSDATTPTVSSKISLQQPLKDSGSGAVGEGDKGNGTEASPLPVQDPPPLPNEAEPGQDDGWAPVWDDHAQAFYFFNRFTNKSQWENPRMPKITQPPPPGVGNYDRMGGKMSDSPKTSVAGSYDPAIHGDYDPNADYAKVHDISDPEDATVHGGALDSAQTYAATGVFNRFTGKWQAAELNPEKFNDENKSRRQMNAFFDVDAAANSHEGKSLKAERSGKKLSKQELKAFKEKRRERKEEKRRAWLRD